MMRRWIIRSRTSVRSCFVEVEKLNENGYARDPGRVPVSSTNHGALIMFQSA